MSKENENFNEAENSALNIADVSTSTFRITLPLEIIWQPKEDITTYELAMCLPYFLKWMIAVDFTGLLLYKAFENDFIRKR